MKLPLVVKIAVFDSGLGSLSVIKSIQKEFKCEIIYFADSGNFPYGKKSIKEIKDIALKTISGLQTLRPDLIIVGSNTLSLALDVHLENIQLVLPPINCAINLTKTRSIAILATESIVKSNLLDKYIQKFDTDNIKIIKINASKLVKLVECGDFYSNPKLVTNVINKTLGSKFTKNNIDVAILASTHLPFLAKFFETEFPEIKFIDPSKSLAKKLGQKYFDSTRARNSLQIFTSGDIAPFRDKLYNMNIKNHVSKFVIK